MRIDWSFVRLFALLSRIYGRFGVHHKLIFLNGFQEFAIKYFGI